MGVSVGERLPGVTVTMDGIVPAVLIVSSARLVSNGVVSAVDVGIAGVSGLSTRS